MSDVPLLVVPRGEFSAEDPWRLPGGASRVPLTRATDGTAPPLRTTVAACHDGTAVVFLFCGEDDEVVATHRKHDAPLWEEDVYEVFLAPRGLTPYFELEVNPLGTLFDARIDSPDGVRATMRTSPEWSCGGIFAFVRRTSGPSGSFDAVLRIPFASLDAPAPQPGEEWRANFFRIDRSARRGDEFLAWNAPLRTPPDFHVAAAFGRLRFE